MSSIVIVTDSTADIPLAVRQKLGIEMIPLKVLFGEQSYLDNIELSPAQFYEMLSKSTVLAKSSQPSPADFYEVFDRAVKEGKQVICISLSAALSGTYQSAVIAKSMLDDDANVMVIDSKSASYGYGQMVVAAAELAQAGASAGEIVAEVERRRRELCLYFLVDTLEYLQKGGRIGKASAVLGTLLNIKPILSIDDEGSVYPVEKARGHKKAMNRIVEMLETELAGRQVQLVIAKTPGFEAGIAEVTELLRSRLQVAEMLTTEIGPVIGAHAGPGTIGIFATPLS